MDIIQYLMKFTIVDYIAFGFTAYIAYSLVYNIFDLDNRQPGVRPNSSFDIGNLKLSTGDSVSAVSHPDRAITSVQKNQYGNLYVTLSDGDTLPVASQEDMILGSASLVTFPDEQEPRPYLCRYCGQPLKESPCSHCGAPA